MAAKRKQKKGNKQSSKSKGSSNSQPTDQPGKISNPSLPTQDTTTDASKVQNGSSSPRCHLLEIPFEIRRQIYSNLLDARNVVGSHSFSYTSRISKGMIRLKASTPPFQLSTAILRANKQIHDESTEVLYSSNRFVRMTIYNDDISWAKILVEHSEMGFVSSNPEHLAKVTRHALDVDIIEERSKQKRCQVLFPAMWLPRLVGFLELPCNTLPKWGQDHEIMLHLRHKYTSGPGVMEQALLEPWRCLRGLRTVIVKPHLVAPAYADSLREDMMGGNLQPWTWLKSVSATKESGSTCFKEGNIADACTAFMTAVAALENTYRAVGRAQILHDTPAQFHQSVNHLRFQCELNIALAICRLKTDWEMGLLGADNAVDLAENNPEAVVWGRTRGAIPLQPHNHSSWYTDAERAKARFRRASIMMALGEYGFACSDLSLAERLRPSDLAIRDAFDKARNEYDPNVRPGIALRRAGLRGW